MKTTLLFILFMAGAACTRAQGTLQFNQVLLVTANDGQVTVPSGKVWKIENVTSNSARYYDYYYANYSTVTWNVNNPNPCNGATSGSYSYPYISTAACSYNDNYMMINGQRTSFTAGNPLWMPAGATLQVNETPCRNTVSFSFSSSTPYRDASAGVYKCGPITVNGGTPVSNSWVISIIEFNIIP